MIVLDGKNTAKQIRKELSREVELIRQQRGKEPTSAIIMVGNNLASEVYVKNKIKSAQEIGIKTILIELPENTTEAQLLEKITHLNNDKQIDGFIIQLPLPEHIKEKNIIEAISPTKDIDGFHPLNMGKLIEGNPLFIPATPLGIMELIKRYKIETEGKHCVIVGRSNIVGKPLAILMSRKGYPGNATVTLCHSKTHNLPEITRQADILIAAIGQANFITAEMVKKDATVIDVGINTIPDNKSKKGIKLVGDVDFQSVSKKVKYITPVPGGVGPMTVAGLLLNTIKAAKINTNFKA